MYVIEPERKIPVSADVDLFVAGGSCTGVFAAVRAARLGMKVMLAERGNCLGGTATQGLVNIWRSLKDTDYKNYVIAGLTAEMTERLVKSGSALLDDNPSTAINFDPNRLKFELDKLVSEEKVEVVFHTLCVGAITDGKDVKAAIIENKDGRSAIKARFFIDATGDGDIMKYLGEEFYKGSPMQPPTTCFLMQGDLTGVDYQKIIATHGSEVGLPDDFGWSDTVAGLEGIDLRADFHVFGVDCSCARDLTFAETEGRRKAYAFIELIKKYAGRDLKVVSLSSLAGIRETNHFVTKTKASGWDMLYGKRYDDAILNGTYRIDMHDEDGGITFMYLNGDKIYMKGAERITQKSNWREELGISGTPHKYYQIPFSVLVGEKFNNLIAAGRMINADKMAFGALRVMVNLNQIGEAAGVAAYLCARSSLPVSKLDGVKVRETLRRGGSAL